MVLIALISFIFVFNLQISEPVAAAKLKLVDHGSIKSTDSYSGYHKESWFAYQKGINYLKVNNYDYTGAIDKTDKFTYIFQKISKTNLKETIYINGKKNGVRYHHTKLTAARYYWRLFRPGMISGNEC